MSEALALRELASAIDRRDALLKFLNDGRCGVALAAESGLSVSCYWGSANVGHKELMAEMTRIVRARVPELLDAVRATVNDEVEQRRGDLAGFARSEPDWCNVCSAPQMVLPDGSHACGVTATQAPSPDDCRQCSGIDEHPWCERTQSVWCGRSNPELVKRTDGVPATSTNHNEEPK